MVSKYNLLFSLIIKYYPPVSCDINNAIDMNDIVKSCSVKIMSVTSFKDMWIKPPAPTNVF